MTRQRTIILGGGLAGLSAAYHLNGEAAVYEQRQDLGGLCRQVRVGGFRFDAVPHVLHFQDPATRQLISRLLEGRLARYQRQARVYSHGAFIRYPFQAHLYGLPQPVIEECLRGRVSASGRGEANGHSTFDEWMRATFGGGIVKHFLKPYNEKFWTLPPSELTCEWLDGLVPVPTLEQTIRGASEDDPAEYGYNVEFWYPSSGGLGAILQALLARTASLHIGRRLVRIDTARKMLRFADGDNVGYDQLLSSIPLPELKGLLDPLPEATARALDCLRWTSICVVHLGIRGDPPVPWHWAYLPGEEAPCYRVGIPSHYAPDAAPAGHHIISAEVSSSPWRPLDLDTVTDRVIGDLIRLGLIRHEREIVVRLPLVLRYGYPIYDHRYAWATQLIRDDLQERDVSLIGRFGSWRYLSMEQTLLDGRQAVAGLMGSGQSSVLDCALR